MRRDKATADLGGEPMAARVARTLRTVAHPVLAVGPSSGTGLEEVDDPREGPLRALASGAEALVDRGWTGPALVLACDVPFVTADLLRFIAGSLGEEHDAAVPFWRGRRQPLVAAYSRQALSIARWVVADGGEAMMDLLNLLNARLLREDEWAAVAPPHSLADLDTPEALERARAVVRAPRVPAPPPWPGSRPDAPRGG